VNIPEEAIRAAASSLCSARDDMYHHDRTDDYPCSMCVEHTTAQLGAASPLIAAQVLREAVERIERRGSLLCDCEGADSEPTNPSTHARMDHHCDCQAVDAAAEMLGSGAKTAHAAQCVCGGGPMIETPTDG
jgi:hypothetical protein